MDLPAKISNTLLLVFMNGVKMSANGDYEIEGPFIRFSFGVKVFDRISFVTLCPEDPSEFEVELPYKYEPWDWFDPSDPHDPKVKMIKEPTPTVTQL